MVLSWSALTVCLALAGAVPAPAPSTLHGTTRGASHPEPNTVVWLEAPPEARPVPRGRVVLDQRNLDFAPHVLAVEVGTVVDFPNHDRVFHNVFSFHDGKRFDLGLYPVGTLRRVTFDHPGVSRIFCNIHPNMAAYVLAVPSPYFAVSDEDGRFTIPELPPGTYTYHAWRPGRAELSGRVVVADGASLDVVWP